MAHHSSAPVRTDSAARVLLVVIVGLAVIGGACTPPVPDDLIISSLSANGPDVLVVTGTVRAPHGEMRFFVDDRMVTPASVELRPAETDRTMDYTAVLAVDTRSPLEVKVSTWVLGRDRASVTTRSWGGADTPNAPEPTTEPTTTVAQVGAAPTLAGLNVSPAQVTHGLPFTVSGTALDADAPGGVSGYFAVVPSVPATPPDAVDQLAAFTAGPDGAFTSDPVSYAVLGAQQLCAVVPDVGPGSHAPAWGCVDLSISACSVAAGTPPPDAVFPDC